MKPLSITQKISMILGLHVVSTVLLIICGISISDTISSTFISVRREVPRLASIAKLVLESQKLVMIVSEMQSAENNFIRKALAQDFMRQRALWEKKICRHFPDGIPGNISNIISILRKILHKTEEIDRLTSEKLVAESRIRKIVDRAAMLEEYAIQETLSEKSSELLLEIFSLFNRSAIEHVPDNIRTFRKEYLFAISELEKELWRHSPPSPGSRRIEEELWYFGADNENIFENALKKLTCEAAISDLIVTMSFLTEEILHNTELFSSSMIKKIEGITQQAQKVTIRNVILPLLVMGTGVFFSILLIFNLRYNAGRRLHSLGEKLRQPDDVAPLPIEGDDEISAISTAVNFFIEKIRLREKQLLESNEGLERRVIERTQQLHTQNTYLQQEIKKNEEVQEALMQSEAKFRLLANRLKILYSRLVTAQEEERRKLAALLHDDIGPSLGAVKFGVEAAIKGGREAGESLEAVIRLVKEIGRNVRRIQSELRPLIIDDLGLLAALDWYCSEYQKIYRQISVEKNITICEEDIPGELKIVLFRIIQEAFNNIAKHSGAANIWLTLSSSDGISLRVDDNGCGILPEILEAAEDLQSTGLGLISMRERTELSNGKFTLISSADGTSLICHWCN